MLEEAAVALAAAVRHTNQSRARYIALAALFDLFPDWNKAAAAEAVGFAPGRPSVNAVANCLQLRRYGPRWWREEGAEAIVEFVKADVREARESARA